MAMWSEEFGVAVVIGIDDVHPESSLDGSDCGGDLDKGALGLLKNFLKRYRDVKVTLFVTPCHMFLPQHLGVERLHRFMRNLFGSRSDQVFYRFFIKKHNVEKFDIEKSGDFNNYLRDLVKRGQVEIGIHGCFHFTPIPPYSSEFLHLNYMEAVRRIKIAIYKLNRAEIPFIKGFAPPGWGVNKETLKALADEGFIYIAGSADFTTPITRNATSREAGLRGISLIFPSPIFSKLINIPRNWTPHRNDVKRALKIIESGGILGIHMHVENEYHGNYLGNGLTVENLSKLEKLVDTIARAYGDSVCFSTFSEIAHHVIHKSPGIRR